MQTLKMSIKEIKRINANSRWITKSERIIDADERTLKSLVESSIMFRRIFHCKVIRRFKNTPLGYVMHDYKRFNPNNKNELTQFKLIEV